MTRARDLAAFVSNADGDIKFDTDTLFIDSSANRVGIGNTTPSTTLHVSGGTAGDAVITIEADTDNNDEDDNPSIKFLQDGAASSAQIGLVGTNGQIFTNSDSNNLYLHAAGSQGIDFATGTDLRMRIDESGNVAIGTTSPTESFTVRGAAHFGKTAIATSADTPVIIKSDTDHLALHLEENSGSESWQIGVDAAGDLGFHNSGAADATVTFNDSGDVGIGTTSPSTVLHISSNDPELMLTDTDTNVDHSLDGNSSTGILRLHVDKNSEGSAPAYIISMQGTTAMKIDQYGQVGINETPVTTVGSAAMLHVDSAGQYNSGKVAAIFESSARGTIRVRSPNDNPAELFWDVNGGARWLMSCRNSSSSYQLNWYNANSSASLTAVGTAVMTLSQTGNLTIDGALSKGSGSFKINHPLPAKSDTHHLVHSFLEGPQADLIYRGKVDLVDGSATVNIDTVSGMTDGTFVLLCDNVQCFTSNEDGWTAIKGSVSGNTLTITAQDNSCTDTISWMVIGERQDPHMKDSETDWTDSDGKVILEPKKESE